MEFTAWLPRPGSHPVLALATIHHLALESRPAVQAVFLLRFASMAIVALDLTAALVVGAIGWLHVTTAIYVLNGMSDVNGDRANRSTRPLAAGLVDVATARSAVLIGSLAGIALSFAASITLGALSIAMVLLGVGYSYGPCWKAGRCSASCVIGGGAALTYAAGAAASGGATWQLIAYAVVLSIWIAFASSSKDFSDVLGDRATGRRTAPVELGYVSASRRLMITTVLAAALLVGVSATIACFWISTIAIVAGTIALAAALSARQASVSHSTSRTPYRVYMVTQYTTCACLLASAVV